MVTCSLFSIQCQKVLKYVIKICNLYIVMIIAAHDIKAYQVKLFLSLSTKKYLPLRLCNLYISKAIFLRLKLSSMS